MASKPTPRIPTLESLVPVQQLLHLTFHRNKNQHRVATWWSSLSQLRRQVMKLIALLEVPGVKTKAEKLAIEKQVEFLREQIVPRCYIAFSTVVADNQYAALGLMLMGNLARLNKLIALPFHKEEEVVEEVAKPTTIPAAMDEDFGEAIQREEIGKTTTKPKRKLDLEDEPRETTSKKDGKRKRIPGRMEIQSATEDSVMEVQGITICANQRPVDTDPETSAKFILKSSKKAEVKGKKSLQKTETAIKAASSTPKAPKKKKKKGDAFDDLFSSLV